MEFKTGEPMFLCGNWKEVRSIIYSLSIKLQKEYKKILIIDTLNNLNPHNQIYKSHSQRDYFRNIYCVRAEKPYDLLARLKTTDNFIKNKRIGVLLVNPLNLIFEDSNEDEVIPMLNNILEVIYYLTKKHNLVTIIANVPHENENTMKAAGIILSKENVVMV